MGLPLCRNCLSEVKPGEDECWDCLGEPIPIEQVTYWVYDGPGLVTISTNTLSLPIVDGTLIFTWPATDVATVTGIKYQIGSSWQTYRFAPIPVVSGDTIQFTISDIIAI